MEEIEIGVLGGQIASIGGQRPGEERAARPEPQGSAGAPQG